MKTFKIYMIERHYSCFEVEAEDIETAKDLLSFGVDAELEPLSTDVVKIETRQEGEDDDVSTEYYDDEWNEL